MKISGFYLLLFCLFVLSSCGEEKKSRVQEKEGSSSEVGEAETVRNEDRTIVFFGNSLTAGMGLDSEEAFPAVLERKIDSLGLPYEVVNAGLSGETTAAGKNRLDWVLNQDVDVFVLELGANDGLRGVPLEETRQNLQYIIDRVREKNPEVEIILAGMQIPPNLGQDYTRGFKNIFPELAKKNNVHLIPFLLEGVAGNPELNQGDGIHPTAEGYKIVAENVWDVLETVLEKQEV